MPDWMAPAGGLGAVALASFVVGLSGAASPGPLLAFVVAQAARSGWPAGILASTGHAGVELVLVAGLALGLAALSGVSWAGIVIGLAGGVVIAVLGVDMLRSAPRLVLPSTGPVGSRTGLAILAGGAVVTLANPFWWFWWLTAGAAFFETSLAATGLAGIPAFYLGHIAADYTWYGGVAGLVGAGRGWLTVTRYRILMAVCGGAMLVIGLIFVGNALVRWIAV